MSKKNKGDDHNVENIFENLHKVLSNMSEEEKDMLMEMVLGSNQNDILNARYYRYDAPDYKAKRIAKWLQPLLHVYSYLDVIPACEKVIKSGEKLSDEKKRNDIRNMFYAFFEEFEPADEMEMEEEEDNEERYGNMSLIAAMQLMELLNINDCEDVVIESLRQDAYFWSYYTEGGEEYITYSLFRMCKEKTDVLLNFLKENGRIPHVKPIVFDALVMIYLHCPEKRLKASAAISNYLGYSYDICMNGADPMNIDAYAYSLASAHVKETLPLLKKMYDNLDIPEIETTGFDDIKETMSSLEVEFKYSHTTIKELIEAIDEEDEEYDDYYDDEYDEIDDDDDADDYTEPLGLTCLYGSCETPKKYTLRIAMLDALEPVERTFTIPSTMYLNHLANIIMISLGHDGMPEDYYYFTGKNDAIYSSIGISITDFESTEITEDTTIQDVLTKKNESILLSMIREDETEWQISVLLESSNGKFKENSQMEVKLTSGFGSYPPASCETYKDYEELFIQKKLMEPNFKAAQKKINEYLNQTGLPF